MSGRIGKNNEKIIELYKSGEGIGDITDSLSLHWSNVYSILKNHDLLAGRKDLRIPEIQKLLKNGMEPEEIRKKYHLDRWKIKRAVQNETGTEYEPEETKVLEPDLENEAEKMELNYREDTRQIRHTQINGKKYADITDFYTESGGVGW